ncbi:MAG: cytochrome C [Methylococcaceae bacterium]
MQHFLKKTHHARFFLASSLILTSIILLSSPDSEAMPSFSRQTGEACNVCHTQSFGPNLTPFGRDFKLGGYTMGGGKGIAAKLPALSGMVMGSFTNTAKDQNPADLNSAYNAGYNKNNNFSFDQASLFYAGRVYGKVGALSQLTYDGSSDRLKMDNTDIRFADRLDLDDTSLPFDLDFTYGISLNNNPTVQDLWNTTPAWGFPYNKSAVQPGVGASTLIDGALGAQVGGATAYTMINDLLYLEAGAYGSFGSNTQNAFGFAWADRFSLSGPAPYWRVALQQNWKGHYFELGHYGMSADVVPGRDTINGSNHYTDVAVDATYQYMANPKHIFEAKTTYIYEDQNLSASQQGTPFNSNANTYLTTFKINTAYTFDQTYGVTFAYNRTTGSTEPALYSGYTDGLNVTGLNRPNSQLYTAELVYVPFGKDSSYLYLMNLRTSLQYIGYSQANGSSAGAQTNNTFMVNGWLAF